METRATTEHGCSLMGRFLTIAGIAVFCVAGSVSAQTAPATTPFDNSANLPDLTKLVPPATDAKGVSSSLQILVLLTVLTLIPSILVMTTAFPRIIIVLALLRQAVGAPQLPPGQVLLGLSLFVTILVMTPTWHKVHAEAVAPYFDSRMGQAQAMDIAAAHLKDFMYRRLKRAGTAE